MMRDLRVGTRGSALALRQTSQVVEQLKSLCPDLRIETSIIKTKGDRILDVPLARIGDKGLFVKEIETALLNGEVDFAVHSMKDLPTRLPEGLCIAAVPTRVDASDVLISNGYGLADLPTHARIGSSSLRRRSQLLSYRADFEISDLRGNLDTRLRKLDEGEFDAIVLAFAGLCRMGWTDRITERIPPEVCLPAVGQGALAIQARADDGELVDLLSMLDDPPSRLAVTAERSLLEALGGGCQVPVGALGCMSDGILRLRGVVASISGDRLVRAEVSGDPTRADSLGAELAEVLLSSGADDILEAHTDDRPADV